MNQHVDRRALLSSSAVAAAAALAAVATDRDARAGETPIGALTSLMAAKDAAYARFDAAIDRHNEMEEAYFAVNRKELLVPLQIGGAQSLYVTAHDLEECSSDCQIAISKRYANARSFMTGLEVACAALHKAEKADLRSVKKIVKEEHARRVAFGFEQAVVELDASSAADMHALTDVCAYRCTSLEECCTKAEYLLTVTGGRFTELLQDARKRS
ncbi:MULTISPECIES: hypothetical protein [unclassified Mesorhizobium]|uniref:hypothetical protein n=1 Tax=unclassified Mesorhizobium TaxID=325217 RepID=UPI00112999F9|nr:MULTISPECIES: hypothetical protein [unclassified Mesorhizobium]MBZ9693571.1 hypothetical protein [Mesorhizobium sp. CO1-1-9]TPK17414.1 hypothetical protein FJ543_02570 [Mesorhizobium sp. B2-5-7]